ncbi:nucleoporin NDC1 [Elysia marginata]|uniref:Nucleoporin NDC1 n=1 Tax=Elysia marginata TaxID=1093978 RepID=A0AAV4J104_9GAST|nr:nucleoporin NDC1 [Elysia marginata]
MAIFLLLSSASFLHPLEWLNGFITSVFSLQVWFSLGVSSACIVVVTWFSLPHFTVIPDIETSQVALALGLLKWARLPLLVVCTLAGTVSSWALSRLSGEQFHSLSLLDETETYARIVLNEHHLFLVLSGIGTGLAFYINFFHKRNHYLAFPHVQKYKIAQIRGELSNLVLSCSWQALGVLKYFYALYFLFGSLPKSWIEDSFKMSENLKEVPINSIRGMLSLTLFWQTFLCVTCLTLAWSLASSIVRVFHTEPLVFPVVSDLDYKKDKRLSEALACNYCPLLQHLALLDFCTLARCCHERRLQLLSLSQPGGHPRTWAAVSGQTLLVIQELCDKLSAENWSIMSKVSMSSYLNGEGASSEAKNNHQNIFYRGKEVQDTAQVSYNNQNELQQQNKIFNLVKGLPFISQVLVESPEDKGRVLFSSCQPQIWAVEGLSEVASKAYTEDKYGVVQTMLPAIIGTLLDFHEVLEKHLKLTASIARKANSSVENPPDLLLKQKLFSSTKSSIYRIVNTYRNHLSDLRLNMDHAKKLHSFTEYLV